MPRFFMMAATHRRVPRPVKLLDDITPLPRRHESRSGDLPWRNRACACETTDVLLQPKPRGDIRLKAPVRLQRRQRDDTGSASSYALRAWTRVFCASTTSRAVDSPGLDSAASSVAGSRRPDRRHAASCPPLPAPQRLRCTSSTDSRRSAAEPGSAHLGLMLPRLGLANLAAQPPQSQIGTVRLTPSTK